MKITRAVMVEVQEGGGVPVGQYVELYNAIARSEPGQYIITITPADSIRSPARGDPRRCKIHGCWCIIRSVTEAEWDPDWFCPQCENDKQHPSKEQYLMEQAVEAFGDKAQMAVMVEEMAELTVELMHHLRGRNGLDGMLEELVDVEIMLQQMKLILNRMIPWYNESYPAIRNLKLSRLEDRLIEREGR